MQALLAILGILASVAIYTGVDRIVEHVDRTRAKAKNMSTDDIIRQINEITAEIRNQGYKVSSMLDRKLQSIPAIAAAGSLNKYLTEIRSKLIDKKVNLEAVETALQNRANTIEQRAATLAAQPDTFRTSTTGKAEFEGIKQAAEKLKGDMLNVQQIEKTI